MRATDIRNMIGRSIFDSHKRPMGRIIGYYTNLKSEVTSIEIELANGDFLNCSSTQIEIKDSEISYIHPWEFEANNLKSQYELIIKRIKALDELYKNGDLEKQLYEEMRAQHSSSINELNEQKDILIESLSERIRNLENQLKELELFLAHSKMQHTSGEINDDSYKIAYDSVNEGFKRILSEKKYLQDLVDYLNETERRDEESSTSPTTEDSLDVHDSESDMVYVKMKEELV